MTDFEKQVVHDALVEYEQAFMAEYPENIDVVVTIELALNSKNPLAFDVTNDALAYYANDYEDRAFSGDYTQQESDDLEEQSVVAWCLVKQF